MVRQMVLIRIKDCGRPSERHSPWIVLEDLFDTLMEGLIQPTLNRERENSDDLGDLFTNTKTTLGRLFGIVEGDNFEWSKIRETPSGQQSISHFAENILEPSIEGDPMLSEPSPSDTSGQKTVQDDRIEVLTDLVTTGLQELD